MKHVLTKVENDTHVVIYEYEAESMKEAMFIAWNYLEAFLLEGDFVITNENERFAFDVTNSCNHCDAVKTLTKRVNTLSANNKAVCEKERKKRDEIDKLRKQNAKYLEMELRVRELESQQPLRFLPYPANKPSKGAGHYAVKYDGIGLPLGFSHTNNFTHVKYFLDLNLDALQEQETHQCEVCGGECKGAWVDLNNKHYCSDKCASFDDFSDLVKGDEVWCRRFTSEPYIKTIFVERWFDGLSKVIQLQFPDGIFSNRWETDPQHHCRPYKKDDPRLLAILKEQGKKETAETNAHIGFTEMSDGNICYHGESGRNYIISKEQYLSIEKDWHSMDGWEKIISDMCKPVKCACCTALEGRGKYINILFLFGKDGKKYCPVCYLQHKGV